MQPDVLMVHNSRFRQPALQAVPLVDVHTDGKQTVQDDRDEKQSPQVWVEVCDAVGLACLELDPADVELIQPRGRATTLERPECCHQGRHSGHDLHPGEGV